MLLVYTGLISINLKASDKHIILQMIKLCNVKGIICVVLFQQEQLNKLARDKRADEERFKKQMNSKKAKEEAEKLHRVSIMLMEKYLNVSS